MLSIVCVAITAATVSACATGQIPTLIQADTLCRDWQVIDISKRDRITEETAQKIEGNNKVRPEYDCEPKANRAKS